MKRLICVIMLVLFSSMVLAHDGREKYTVHDYTYKVVKDYKIEGSHHGDLTKTARVQSETSLMNHLILAYNV